MPVVRTFLPEVAAVHAARSGISLDQLSLSYAMDALHARRPPAIFDRTSCADALTAILRRPVFQYGRVGRSKASVRANLARLKQVLGIDASQLRIVQVRARMTALTESPARTHTLSTHTLFALAESVVVHI